MYCITKMLQLHDLQTISARRLPWLLFLLLAVGVICAALALRSWSGHASHLGISKPSTMLPAAAQEDLRRASVRPNPAAQMPGPPDPVAQETAAASAAKAAKAAADLAGSAASNH